MVAARRRPTCCSRRTRRARPRVLSRRRVPQKYRRGAFVAFRGSWNRDTGTGYQITFVPFGADGRPLGSYEPFVTGFLVDAHRPATWGRPVGVLVLPDGSLLFTEEENQRLYRVAYRP
jgi:glucose/arabinose dehydrogenase